MRVSPETAAPVLTSPCPPPCQGRLRGWRDQLAVPPRRQFAPYSRLAATTRRVGCWPARMGPSLDSPAQSAGALRAASALLPGMAWAEQGRGMRVMGGRYLCKIKMRRFSFWLCKLVATLWEAV